MPCSDRAIGEDPDGVLVSVEGRLFIDEWQEVPEVLDAVKRAVDAGGGLEAGRCSVQPRVVPSSQPAAVL